MYLVPGGVLSLGWVSGPGGCLVRGLSGLVSGLVQGGLVQGGLAWGDLARGGFGVLPPIFLIFFLFLFFLIFFYLFFWGDFVFWIFFDCFLFFDVLLISLGIPPPPQKQTQAYGQRVAGTHPTGMHSYLLSTFPQQTPRDAKNCGA